MMAYLNREHTKPHSTDQTQLYALVRDKRPAVRVCPLPFVAKRYRR
jgi:hypothetical protein